MGGLLKRRYKKRFGHFRDLRGFEKSYEQECELQPSTRKKVLIIGAGPIRIGQGIEFDYCTVHAVKALKEECIKAHIINNNPETVSTDYDTSDKLFFEPLSFEDVMNVIEKENYYGVMVHFEEYENYLTRKRI